MATFTVSTSQNYTAINGGSFADYDRITIDQGATLTVNTDTNIIERVLCITLGQLLVENASTTTPIFVKTGENGATALAQLRFEGGGSMKVRGNWISLGTSNGNASQTFSLPMNSALEMIPDLPTVFVFKDGATKPEIYNRVGSFTDCFGDEKLGSVFTHDPILNTITFGDGTNGCILPDSAVVRIPNIMFFDETSGTGYTDFDLATSGALDLDKCSFGENYALNFSSASSVRVTNSAFDFAREDMNCGSQQGVYFENVGIQMQVLSHYMNLSASNNFIMRNVFIYNLENTAQYHGFYPTNASGGEFTECRVVAPLVPSSTSRAVFYITSPNLTFKDCYVATQGVGWNFGAGSGNTTITDCGFNGAGKRNATAYSPYMIQSANSSNNTIVRTNSYPLLPADGAIAPNTYAISMSTGTSKITVHDCDIYVGEAGNPARTNNPIFSNGVGHRVNKIRIHGDFSGDTINHSTASANLIAKNITFMNTESNANDMEWTDGGFHDLVASPDNIDTVPSASGKDVGTFHHYLSDDKTSGRLYKPMGAHSAGSSKYTEISVTGNVLFNNAGAMYMDSAGDIVEFESNVHGGITAFTGSALRGSGTGNFTIEFALRNPDGVYGALQTLNTTNLQSALSALTGYDSNVGLQIKYRVTRTVSNVTDYLNHIAIHTTIDANYESPFEVYPTEAIFKGLTSGDVIYIEDASNVEKAFTVSDGSDYVITLPNANDGETWTYVVKRAGFEHQKGSITIASGSDAVINVVLAQKVQPVGGAMYTGSANGNINVVFDLATPQLSIDIGDASVSAQNVLDAVENALITNNGMKWLAQQGGDINFANLGGAGSFLFAENNVRVRRANSADDDAEVSAYVFSTDGTSTDESNGTVKLFSGTIVNDFLQADFDLNDNVSMNVGQLYSVLASMVELDTEGVPHYRFNAPAVENVQAGLDESGLHSALDSYTNKDGYKATVDSLATQSSLDSLHTKMNTVDTILDNIVANGVTLTASERTAIATAIEQAILDEGDGQMVIDAIVQAIGNENITASTIAQAVWSDTGSYSAGSKGNQIGFINKVIGWIRDLL